MGETAPVGTVRPGSVLHIGCGHAPLPDWFDGCSETRLDIDPACNPDIVASMTDLGDLGGFDYVYSSHALEHLPPFEGERALREMQRVLKDGGVAFIYVPDLEDVKATDEVLYVSPRGPVSGLDMIYGMRSMVEESPFMAHRNGFVKETLERALSMFDTVMVQRVSVRNLFAAARK